MTWTQNRENKGLQENVSRTGQSYAGKSQLSGLETGNRRVELEVGDGVRAQSSSRTGRVQAKDKTARVQADSRTVRVYTNGRTAEFEISGQGTHC